MPVESCLIVAAGKGTRLKEYGDLKPLVPVGGIALIERGMRVAHAAGVKHFVVVTGYKTELLTPALETIAARNQFDLRTVFNPAFEEPNGLSVLCGAPFLKGPFYLTMCDHMVEREIYTALSAIDLAEDSVALGVDYRLDNPDVDIDDVTKVATRDGRIHSIGKNITQYDGYDTGVFRAGPALFDAIGSSRDNTGDCSISGGMNILCASARARAVDTGNARWIDVDSPPMHDIASDWAAKHQHD